MHRCTSARCTSLQMHKCKMYKFTNAQVQGVQVHQCIGAEENPEGAPAPHLLETSINTPENTFSPTQNDTTSASSMTWSRDTRTSVPGLRSCTEPTG